MYASAFVLGFHGCDREVGEMVLEGKAELKASSNRHDWLGEGIYFWENSPRRALEWAKFLRDHPGISRRKITEPFVVGAIVDLGRCLDLTEAASIEVVRSSFEGLREAMTALGLDLPRNQRGSSRDEDMVKRNLDCAVIDYTHLLREQASVEPYDTVRGVFQEGEPLYEGAGFREKTHIQIAVRKAASIRGYFRPKLEHA